MLGQQILGMRAKNGESLCGPQALRCIDPLKKNSYKKNFQKKIFKGFSFTFFFLCAKGEEPLHTGIKALSQKKSTSFPM